MKKQLIALVLMLSVSASAFAVEAEIGGLWYELLSKANEAIVIEYKNGVKYSGDIVIPETVEYEGDSYSVTSIDNNAFCYCSLTSLTIPSSVTRIASWAFGWCSLTSVHISDIAAWCKIAFNDRDSNPLNHAHHLYLGEALNPQPKNLQAS